MKVRDYLHPEIQDLRRRTHDEFHLKQCYRKHNMYVMQTVPKKNLLVWNVKEEAQ